MNDAKTVDIIGWEGLYTLDSLGRVKTVERFRKSKGNNIAKVKSRFIKTYVNQRGYLSVVLKRYDKSTHYNIHRLLALHFISNPNNLPIVRHLNDNPLDNRLENLAWGTVKDNLDDAIKNKKLIFKKGKDNPKFGKRYPNAKNIKLILDTETGIFYYGALEAGYAKNIDSAKLWRQLNGVQPNNTSLIYA